MTTQPPGRFVWHEVYTPDPAAAATYYAELFGWSSQEVDMGHAGTFRAIIHEKESIGSFSTNKGDDPPNWGSTVTVDDLEKALATAESKGCAIDNPGTDVPGVGRWARFTDPQGAVIYPFVWASEPPPDTPDARYGSFVWHELLARDVDQARELYTAVFGWDTEVHDMGAMGPYTLFKRAGVEVGGIMPMPPDAQGPCQWLPYVHVEDVDERVEKVKSLGGQVFVPPMDIPNVGRFSVTADPQGAMLALYRHA